ncbi:MAG: glycosyltransferase family 4 protein [Pseudomonadota bacterium]
MRITFVLPSPNLKGGTRVVAIHAENLMRRGHIVTVVTPPGRAPRLPRWSPKRLLRKLMPPPPRGPTHLDGRGLDLRILDRIRPVTAADVPDADVIVGTWWETAYMVAALPAAKGAKVHFVQHHEVHEHLPHHITRGVHYLPLRRIVISDWLQEIMAQTYGDQDTDLVPNGVDLAQFQAPPRERGSPPTVGFVYAGGPYKAMDVMAEALAQARRSVPELKAVALSARKPGPDLPPGVEVVQAPPQSEIAAVYAKADVWAMPSHVEGFALPILEAMACRTPVVSTAAGAARSLIDEGVNGHIVPVADAQALAARLVEVATMPQEAWRVMSEAARTTAEQHGWEASTDRLEAALERAAAGTP